MADTKNTGRIVEIKGVVLDAVFPEQLPAIYSALKIQTDAGELIAEVQQHLGDDRVRAVAMDTTDGLARGTEVVDTGAPISVPVGDQTLGRVWNVIGDPVDGKEASTGARWTIHPDRPPVGREGRVPGAPLAAPSRPAALRRPVGEDRDLRDGHQGDRPDRAVRP